MRLFQNVGILRDLAAVAFRTSKYINTYDSCVIKWKFFDKGFFKSNSCNKTHSGHFVSTLPSNDKWHERNPSPEDQWSRYGCRDLQGFQFWQNISQHKILVQSSFRSSTVYHILNNSGDVFFRRNWQHAVLFKAAKVSSFGLVIVSTSVNPSIIKCYRWCLLATWITFSRKTTRHVYILR